MNQNIFYIGKKWVLTRKIENYSNIIPRTHNTNAVGKVNAKDFRAFLEQVGPRILLLKSADYFGTSGQEKEES